MPARNTIRRFDAPAYYHVYNRGAGKQPIFHDDQDREKFLSFFDRYLDANDDEIRGDGSPYEKYELRVVAYCLMDNHFHLLLYQDESPDEVTGFMRSLATAYTMYYNLKYKSSGHLFQGRFKASLISDDAYLLHVTRYIHMNPRNYLRFRWSSISAYLGRDAPDWLDAKLVTDMSGAQYKQFMRDYEGKKAELEFLKGQIAG